MDHRVWSSTQASQNLKLLGRQLHNTPQTSNRSIQILSLPLLEYLAEPHQRDTHLGFLRVTTFSSAGRPPPLVRPEEVSAPLEGSIRSTRRAAMRAEVEARPAVFLRGVERAGSAQSAPQTTSAIRRVFAPGSSVDRHTSTLQAIVRTRQVGKLCDAKKTVDEHLDDTNEQLQDEHAILWTIANDAEGNFLFSEYVSACALSLCHESHGASGYSPQNMLSAAVMQSPRLRCIESRSHCFEGHF